MIPLLLWRCPLCATNDALVHIPRLFRADLVRCRRCHAEWRVRRVPGDNFYLKLVRVGRAAGNGIPARVGTERTITAWYDLMKSTVSLVPIHDPEVNLPPDEMLYLASDTVELEAEESDPSFFPVPESPEATRVEKWKVRGRVVGTGRLFLTDRRLLWRGEGVSRSFPLRRLNPAFALMGYRLALMVEMRLYLVRFLEESVLKWVTYLALVARQVEAKTGHRIVTSHF